MVRRNVTRAESAFVQSPADFALIEEHFMKKLLITCVLLITTGLLFAGDGGTAGSGAVGGGVNGEAKNPAKTLPAAIAEKKSTASQVSIAERLAEILPPAAVTRLVEAFDTDKTGNAWHIFSLKYGEKDMSVSLAPTTDTTDTILKTWQQDKPVFMIENLYLYKKASSGSVDVQAISDILHSVSTLEGVEYYSASRKKMRTLYEKSYAVKSVASGKKTIYERVPDDLAASEQLVLQKDLTFGEFIYKYSYFAENNTAGFVCENAQKLKYGIFSLVDPYNMNASLIVIDLGDYLLAYANTRANFAKMPGLSEKLKNSFSTRSDAVYRWFIGQYEKK